MRRACGSYSLRWRALARRRDCKKAKIQSNTIPQSASLPAPFTQGSLWHKDTLRWFFYLFSAHRQSLHRTPPLWRGFRDTKNARRLTTTVERTFFENSPKSFLLESFLRSFFSKKRPKPLAQTNIYPHIAFSFGTKGAKEKALQKENAVLWGVAPNPIRFLKKAKPKTFKLGVCAIKVQTAYPDGVIKTKNARRLTTTVERTIFENSQKPFCKKVFCGAFFQKSDINLNTN